MNIQIDEFLNPRCILILYFTTWNQSYSHNMIFLINYYLSFYKVCYTPFSDCSFQPITFESRVRGTPMTHAYDSTQAKPCQVNIRLVAPYWIWWSCWTLYFIGEEKVSHCLVALLVFIAIFQLQCYCKIKRKE